MDNSISRVPAPVREMISGIVTAVHDGDDARIKALLKRLDADPAALGARREMSVLTTSPWWSQVSPAPQGAAAQTAPGRRRLGPGRAPCIR
ncbi:hypothetical protein ACFVY1_43025 [Streptomyces sp. NPDC058293]|uniref:hypothetical protein n=1 Tax=Streptomyces sp. NPDC058293 TaxID=3346429 RepID=UPI0036EDD5B1